jgi:hypothetical protein
MLLPLQGERELGTVGFVPADTEFFLGRFRPTLHYGRSSISARRATIDRVSRCFVVPE